MWFILAVAGLIVGYLVYGKIVEKVFGADDKRPTPAVSKSDGVDYVEMPTWKVWLIQLLNIAGIGPVFGPILGALYGPTALLWVVLGSIFAGAVHDYMSGMLSVRYGGANVPDVVGYNLGKIAHAGMGVFAVILLLLVGTVFATSPAGLMAHLMPEIGIDGTMGAFGVWLAIIFFYYFMATLVPIDKLIGVIYPFFGVLLIFMAVGVTLALFVEMPDQFYAWADWGAGNQHPNADTSAPLWPLMFLTIACGALSGFHSTQSPLMARCLKKETDGRKVFYGGMIAEGFIGLVWVTVGMTFYDSPDSLLETVKAGTASKVVFDSCSTLLGGLGGVLAILGVVVLPVTSGDTAFRAARITLADMLKFDQRPIARRLMVAVPVLALGAILSQVNFTTIWNYFGWANQTLAGIVLWACAAYLFRKGRLHWICTVPAVFITAASITFILWSPTLGFHMDIGVSRIIGAVFAVLCLAALLLWGKKPVEGAPENV
jgi:carbon starvation protein CstA